MKKIFALLLVLVLALSLVACQDAATEESEEEAVSFAPQTAEEFFEAVLNDFNSRTEYRRRSESYPEKPEEGDILDLYITNAGTEEQTLSGTLKEKETGAVNTLYGEGDTFARGPYLATSNVVNYVVMDSAAPVSPYLPTKFAALSVLRPQLEKNLLSEKMAEYLSDATLTENEDGSYTLTVPLAENDIYNLGEFSGKSESYQYRYPSIIVYTADKSGALTSLTYSLKDKYVFLHTDFSYESGTHKKPLWFNKENPAETEGMKASVTHVLEQDAQITLTPDSEGVQVSVYAPYKKDYIINVPDYIPTDAYYTGITGSVALIFEQWDPDMKIYSGTGNGYIFFKKGTRPAESDSRNIYFEGEWEMHDGFPRKKR